MTMPAEDQNNSMKVLGSFASLLSGALTVDSEAMGPSLGDSGDKLQCFISPSVGEDQVCCVLPSLLLKQSLSSSPLPLSIEDSSSLKLARPLELCQGELAAAPMVILGNVSESFMTLVDSRLRSSFTALVRQSQQQTASVLPRVLVGLLSAIDSPISSTTMVTTFRVVPDVKKPGSPVMPLAFETVVDLSILGELVSVKIEAPGAIQGMGHSQHTVQRIEIILDTKSLLQSMMKQARYAVRMAMSKFSDIAAKLVVAMSNKKTVYPMPGPFSSQTEQVPSTAGDKSMPPPPPRKPSRKSLGNLLERSRSPPSAPESTANATWDTTREPKNSDVVENDAGLRLLTTAAALKRRRSSAEEERDLKRIKHDPVPRKVPSCPSLGASSA